MRLKYTKQLKKLEIQYEILLLLERSEAMRGKTKDNLNKRTWAIDIATGEDHSGICMKDGNKLRIVCFGNKGFTAYKKVERKI